MTKNKIQFLNYIDIFVDTEYSEIVVMICSILGNGMVYWKEFKL